MSDYSKDLTIEHQALDVECLKQSQLFMKYSELAADARLAMDRAKELLDVTEAECSHKYRQKSLSEGAKVTEAMAQTHVLLDPTCKQAREALNVARHEYEILSSAVEAFQQRKAMLENLIKLLVANYFAAPTSPRNLDREIGSSIADSIDAKSRQDIAEKVRRLRGKA